MTPQAHAQRKWTPTWSRGEYPPGGTVILGELVTAGARLTHKQPGWRRFCPRRCLGPELHPACWGWGWGWGAVPFARDAGSRGPHTVHLSPALPAHGPAFVPGGGGGGGSPTSGGAGRSPVQLTRGADATAGARRVTVSTREGRTPEETAQRGALVRTPRALACPDPDPGTAGRPLLHFLRCADRAELPRAMTSPQRGVTSSTCPARATRPPPALPPAAPAPAAAISAYPSPPPPSGAAPWRSGCAADPPESGLARPTPPEPGPRPRPGPAPAPVSPRPGRPRAPPRPHPRLGPKRLLARLQDPHSTLERAAPRAAEPRSSHLERGRFVP